MGTAGIAVSGKFEREERILHLWFDRPVDLRSDQQVRSFFDEVQRAWIDPTPGSFYLLVNYNNLTIDPVVTEAYAQAIQKFQHRLLGTYRYRIPDDLTAVSVRLGNMRLSQASRIYPSEVEARAAIRLAKMKTTR
jgi:hypothetical protein